MRRMSDNGLIYSCFLAYSPQTRDLEIHLRQKLNKTKQNKTNKKCSGPGARPTGVVAIRLTSQFREGANFGGPFSETNRGQTS